MHPGSLFLLFSLFEFSCSSNSNIDDFEDEIFSMHDPAMTDAARVQEIMDVKYASADINGL
jgi:hypothetical protein